MVILCAGAPLLKPFNARCATFCYIPSRRFNCMGEILAVTLGAVEFLWEFVLTVEGTLSWSSCA